jgi:hypothetical protein
MNQDDPNDTNDQENDDTNEPESSTTGPGNAPRPVGDGATQTQGRDE